MPNTHNPDDTPITQPTLLLGFDFGIRYIGIASGNSITATATPLKPITAKKGVPEWLTLDALIRSWKANLLIIGLPLMMNGEESPMSFKARKFSARLRNRYAVPCIMTDERLSTFSAQLEARNANGKIRGRHKKTKQTESTHSIAACVILDTWFSLPPQEQQQLINQSKNK